MRRFAIFASWSRGVPALARAASSPICSLTAFGWGYRSRACTRARACARSHDGRREEIAPVVDKAADELHALRPIRRASASKSAAGLLPVRCAEKVVDLLQRDAAVGKADDHVQHALRIP